MAGTDEDESVKEKGKAPEKWKERGPLFFAGYVSVLL